MINCYITYFLIFCILCIIEYVYFKIAKHFNIIDKPNIRSSHNNVIVCGAGIIFPIGIILCNIFFGFTNPLFLIGLLLVSLISFLDDISNISVSIRLIIQFIAMILLCVSAGIMNMPYWTLLFIPILIIGVGALNAYNFMDGINGITCSYSLSILVPLIFLNKALCFINMQYLIVISIACLILSYLNFRPKNKALCFIGDVGSISVAFILLFALGKLIVQTNDFSYMIFFGLYAVDSILTICHRIMLKENLSISHRKHAYQIMSNELNIPHEYVSLGYGMIQLLISFGLIVCNYHLLYVIIIFTILSILYILFMKNYYYLHEEYLNKVSK